MTNAEFTANYISKQIETLRAEITRWQRADPSGICRELAWGEDIVKKGWLLRTYEAILVHAEGRELGDILDAVGQRVTADLLENRDRHCSTNIFANAVAEAERAAKADWLHYDMPALLGILNRDG